MTPPEKNQRLQQLTELLRLMILEMEGKLLVAEWRLSVLTQQSADLQADLRLAEQTLQQAERAEAGGLAAGPPPAADQPTDVERRPQ